MIGSLVLFEFAACHIYKFSQSSPSTLVLSCSQLKNISLFEWIPKQISTVQQAPKCRHYFPCFYVQTHKDSIKKRLAELRCGTPHHCSIFQRGWLRPAKWFYLYSSRSRLSSPASVCRAGTWWTSYDVRNTVLSRPFLVILNLCIASMQNEIYRHLTSKTELLEAEFKWWRIFERSLMVIPVEHRCGWTLPGFNIRGRLTVLEKLL